MENRNLKTDKWISEGKQRAGNLPPRMSEEIAKNISNNLVKIQNKVPPLRNQPHESQGTNVVRQNIKKPKSREISFNNTFTNNTLNSSLLDSIVKQQSFGEPVAKRPGNFLSKGNKFIVGSKDVKINAWNSQTQRQTRTSNSILKPSKSRSKSKNFYESGGKENINLSNTNIIKSNFTLNPKNEYLNEGENITLTQVTEEPSDYSMIHTQDQDLGSTKNIFKFHKEAKAQGDNSTVSSTIHSKINYSQDHSKSHNYKRFSKSLKKFEVRELKIPKNNYSKNNSFRQSGLEYSKDFGQKLKNVNSVDEDYSRKTKSKTLNNQNMVKDLILNTVNFGEGQPIEVYNISLESKTKNLKTKNTKNNQRVRPKKSKNRNRYRGEVSSEYGVEFRLSPVDAPLREVPSIQLQLKKVGIKTHSKNYTSEVVQKKELNMSNLSRGAKTEQLNIDSRGFGFSKRNLISEEHGEYLNYTADEINLSKHNKFLKNPRKQRSNIKINFGVSLTPKKKVISKLNATDQKGRPSKMGEGKKLFDTMQEHKIQEEVQKRLKNQTLLIAESPTIKRKPEPVKIRSHDDVMKKSIDFVHGLGMRSDFIGGQGSLAESILKKKEISQISLDYIGA
jgi:hypothetical protein